MIEIIAFHRAQAASMLQTITRHVRYKYNQNESKFCDGVIITLHVHVRTEMPMEWKVNVKPMECVSGELQKPYSMYVPGSKHKKL